MQRPSELPDLKVGTVVALDTECSGLHPDDGHRVAVVSLAWLDPDDQVVSVAFPFDQGLRDKANQAALFGVLEDELNQPEQEWRYLLEWAADKRLVYHNAKYDMHMVRSGVGCPRVDGGFRFQWEGADLEDAFWWDTQLATFVIHPRDSTALKKTAERLGLLGGGERDKEEALGEHLKNLKKSLKLKLPQNEKRYDLADWGVIRPYAARDTELTLLLYLRQQHELDVGDGHPGRVQREFDLMRALYRIEARGLGYDVEGSLAAAAEITDRAERIRQSLPFRATIPAAKKFFFGHLGIPPYKTTDSGEPQLDDEVLHRMVQDGHQWAAEWDEYTSLERAKSMWYAGYPQLCGADGRLRTNFKQTFVKSGRMSVERLQLQAIPKDDKALDGIPTVRSFVQARDGYQLWNLDLSQAELRVATKYAGCIRMREMLEGGADLHGVTTEEIFHIDKKHPEWAYKRDIAKRLTFGGIFQIGGRRFQATLSKLAHIDWPLEQCEDAVKQWRRLYPEFGQAYYRYMQLAERQGWIYILGQERSYFGPRDYPNSAWNRRVQGSLAKFLKLWLIMHEREFPGTAVLTVHDSIVLELPETCDLVPYGEDGTLVPQLVAEAADAAAEYATQLFGIQMRCDAGPWHKTSKTVKDDDQYEGVA